MRWLMDTLPSVRTKQCTEPRDKIFALYGLCRSIPRPLPDYTLTASEVYRAFVVNTITTTHSLDVFQEIDVRSTSLGTSLPSWVPDWSVAIERMSFKDRHDLIPITWVPDNVPATNLDSLQDASILPLVGLIVDEVVHTGEMIGLQEISEIHRGQILWLHNLWRSWTIWNVMGNKKTHTANAEENDGSEAVTETNNDETGSEERETRDSEGTPSGQDLTETRNSRQPIVIEREYPTQESSFSCFVRTMITNAAVRV